MKCPNCPDVRLAISARQGVELDYCPQCRGVWLDRGELDKLLELEAQSQIGVARRHDHSYEGERGAPRSSHDYGQRHGGPERRRKSWLEEIFD
jgi:uncharacterized protein